MPVAPRPTPTASCLFELAIPPSWTPIELRPAYRDRAIADAVYERSRGLPELRAARASLTAYVRDVAARAWEGGARYCAVFAEPAGEGLVLGSLTVTLLPELSDRGGGGFEDLIERVQGLAVEPRDGTWSSLTCTDIAGTRPCARQFGIREAVVSAKGMSVRHVFMHTFVPVTGGVLLVACASAATDLADPLLELFARVSDTLAVVEPG